MRLALGYSAVTLAGISFYIDRKFGWEATQSWILSAVVVYFTLNLALTIWIWAVEDGQVFEGTRVGGDKVRNRAFLDCQSAVKIEYAPKLRRRIIHFCVSVSPFASSLALRTKKALKKTALYAKPIISTNPTSYALNQTD